MNTILGLSCAVISLAAFVAACRMRGYAAGKDEGFKMGREKGFEEGFAEGKNSETRWWIDLEYQAECMRERIRIEEGKG
ncbi:MAG TPA: hypothetical protein VKP61_00680 [Candidatus Acidoferrum sp.]|nr:hypothetical protein [Candidatus Acidoferrum sp.]